MMSPMTWYAHALIETGGRKYDRGDPIDPSDISELMLLSDYGTIREEPYSPAADRSAPPATLEIEGVRYIQVTDSEGSDEVAL